jgi:hypothetical protein
MLAATWPEYVLIFGCTADETKAVLRGLRMAFGPPKSTKSGLADVANLAEVLWESIPTRSQRRLRELCDGDEEESYEQAVAEARRGVRRAGFFICGDLGTALREVCAEEGFDFDEALHEVGLEGLCARSEAIRDLVRLATHPAFAEARWQPPRLMIGRSTTGFGA